MHSPFDIFHTEFRSLRVQIQLLQPGYEKQVVDAAGDHHWIVTFLGAGNFCSFPVPDRLRIVVGDAVTRGDRILQEAQLADDIGQQQMAATALLSSTFFPLSTGLSYWVGMFVMTEWKFTMIK
jgi:hypothetical protein